MTVVRIVGLLLLVVCMMLFVSCSDRVDSSSSVSPSGLDDPIDDPVDDPVDDPGGDPGEDPGEDPGDDPGDDPPADSLITSEMSNNLSYPVVFAEGHGLGGIPVEEATGLRESQQPNFIDSVLLDGVWYFPNGTGNSWQADWEKGEDFGGNVFVEVNWSDNLLRHTFSDQSHVRIEVVLNCAVAPMTAYEMVSLGGLQDEEVWGTNRATYFTDTATVYSPAVRLKIERLDGQGGTPLLTVYNSSIYERYGVDGQTDAYSAEVNASGKVIYGHNWDVKSVPLEDRVGWYRLTFSVDPEANYSIADEAGDLRSFGYASNVEFYSLSPFDLALNEINVIYEPVLIDNRSSSVDIYVKDAGGGSDGE